MLVPSILGAHCPSPPTALRSPHQDPRLAPAPEGSFPICEMSVQSLTLSTPVLHVLLRTLAFHPYLRLLPSANPTLSLWL